MPKISFSREFQVKRNERLEKLTLEKGQKARVALLGDMEAEYVHNLAKVVLDEDTGKAMMEQRQNQRGGTYEVPVTEFVGRFACTGDFETVTEKGTDSDNCPFCRAAEESGAFEAPRRYMAVLAFVYETKQGSFAPQLKPFQGKILPWVFTDGKWAKMADIDEEFEDEGGVFGIDLTLGPCEAKLYQNYEIHAARECVFRQDKKREEYVQELLEAYDGDITTLFGRRVSEVESKRFIREVQDAYDAGFNPSGGSNDRMRSSSAKAVDSLFGGDDDDKPQYGDDEESESSNDRDASNVRDLSDLLD